MYPYVIFDKSVLQMLRSAELEELRRCFEFVSVPTLVREVIADLRKPPTNASKMPEALVRNLAVRMSTMHLVTPANFRKLAIADLHGSSISITTGQIPLDPSARNVHASADHKLLGYDATLDQELWNRWARGDFSLEDLAVAQSWRDGLQKVNLKALGDQWKQFLAEHIGQCSSIEDAVVRVDRLLSTPLVDVQSRLVAVLIMFLRAPFDVAFRPAVTQALDARAVIVDIAPYASSILRLYLTFLVAIARGFVRLQASNYVDLQYLFYAPFCMGFASNDRLHKQLWPAASGPAVFIDGARLQADLAERSARRALLTQEQLAEQRATHAYYPIEIPGSIINEVWAKWMKPRDQMLEAMRNRPALSDIPQSVHDGLTKWLDDMKELQRQKDPDAGEWPLGPKPGTEKPGP